MWNYPDAETLEWTKNLKVKGKIFGDGSQLSNLPAGTETDPIFVAASGAINSNIAVTSAALTTGADPGHTHSIYFDASSDVDHNATTNTHNLTTDIDHTAIQNIGILTHAAIDIFSGAYTTHKNDATIHYVNPGFLTAETDPRWEIASAAIRSNISTISGANKITSAAYMTHAASGAIHFISGAIYTEINTKATSGAVYARINTISGALDTHISSGSIHFTSGAIYSAIGNKFNETSGSLTYTNYQITSGAYIAHAADNSDPHGATLTQTNITGTNISGALFVTADYTTASGAYVADCVYTSGALGAIASNYPIGTLWIQYTA